MLRNAITHLPLCALSLGVLFATAAQSQSIDESQTITLAGNTRPEASAANDRGLVEDAFPLPHIQLLLKRPAKTEAALNRFIDQLQDRTSPNFHRWLTAAQFGAAFGPDPTRVDAVVAWLGQHGFSVNAVSPGRTFIDFSGNAGQVRAAFHTEIHHLSVNGAVHTANMSDPRVPVALQDVVAGIVSLHDFRPHTNFKARPAYTFSNGSGTYEAVTPADLATIYNFNPLFAAGITGQGQRIVVIEDTDVYSKRDWTRFRQVFGLAKYTGGSFTQVHPRPPVGHNNCAAPGVLGGNEGEAELDAEWASAAAPDAAIELASCADTVNNFGGLLALQNLVDGNSPPPVVSISYGECEAINGATANAAYAAIYQQAITLGMSIFVSSGDEGAASCDANQISASHGIGVSAFTSTPYNVSVGGTDFGDTFAKSNAEYWRPKNRKYFESARSYIPEIPWNNSCASVLITTALGFTVPYGPAGSCNSPTGENYFQTTASGSGGPSGCATGSPRALGYVGGTCQGYAKPSWQTLIGNPDDGVRDSPDVALFAANGVWSHNYIFCDSDPYDYAANCTGAPSTWPGAGGTSFASPIMAGVQALINQYKGAPQGNPNPRYYELAASAYAGNSIHDCNSTRGKKADASCIFYDVTVGDMDVNCSTTPNCFLDGSAIGVLSRSNDHYRPAYGTNVGWDFATGIGTINAYNLVKAW